MNGCFEQILQQADANLRCYSFRSIYKALMFLICCCCVRFMDAVLVFPVVR